jgi:hypothetical protein
MDNDPTDQIIIEQIQDHITIEKLIKEKRTLTNARNRLNYKLRSANGTNLQLKLPSDSRPRGRPVQKITDENIQSYISTHVKRRENRLIY